jgi:hypothetical protein
MRTTDALVVMGSRLRGNDERHGAGVAGAPPRHSALMLASRATSVHRLISRAITA